ncbi:MAG: hypothetical protein H7A24_04460 [Leptospiraceae bacterium]|nr:hypothetical protein [Leptospiraceae bacterium]MCP5511108.1 hypothetical protein [Leptospiraceae bacterium]
MSDLDYKKNPDFIALDNEMSSLIPNFQKVEEALNKTPPILVSNAILEDVGFTYLLDYYLKYASENTVKRLFQNPMFSREALMELFNCQVTKYHKAVLTNLDPPDLFSNYWAFLSKAELAILFKELLNQTRDTDAIRQIIERMDVSFLKLMTSAGTVSSQRVLNFLKEIGNDFQKLVAKDMDLYEYAVELAEKESDQEFLAFIENYTAVFVQLRVASFFIKDIESKISQTGQIPSYMEFISICVDIPMDTLGLALELFHEKKWVSQNEVESIFEFYMQKRKKG